MFDLIGLVQAIDGSADAGEMSAGCSPPSQVKVVLLTEFLPEVEVREEPEENETETNEKPEANGIEKNKELEANGIETTEEPETNEAETKEEPEENETESREESEAKEAMEVMDAILEKYLTLEFRKSFDADEQIERIQTFLNQLEESTSASASAIMEAGEEEVNPFVSQLNQLQSAAIGLNEFE